MDGKPWRSYQSIEKHLFRYQYLIRASSTSGEFHLLIRWISVNCSQTTSERLASSVATYALGSLDLAQLMPYVCKYDETHSESLVNRKAPRELNTLPKLPVNPVFEDNSKGQTKIGQSKNIAGRKPEMTRRVVQLGVLANPPYFKNVENVKTKQNREIR